MAATGINKRKLAKYHGQVYCYMDLPETAKKAKERGVTRAAVCMEESAGLKGEVIYAIGNAPTALVRLYEMIKEGRIRPVSYTHLGNCRKPAVYRYFDIFYSVVGCYGKEWVVLDERA